MQRIVIRGALVVDGTGAPAKAADVVVFGDTIEALLSPGAPVDAALFDATGLVLAPGFIDSHTHDDLQVLQADAAQPKLSQGVTTVVTGNCGISLAPAFPGEAPPPLDLFGAGERPASFTDYLALLQSCRPPTNVVPLIGHTTLRALHVADLQREATAAERQAMRRDVEAALQAGAFGLSTGVYYPPARAATVRELVAVAAPAGVSQAILAMHIRDEGDRIDEALREALQVQRETGARLVLSHHKVVGPSNHGRTRDTLHLIEQAARGDAVCLDCYPYEASSTMLDADKAARTRRVQISWSRPHPAAAGRDLADLAAQWGMDLHAAASRLMPGGAVYFGMAAEDVDRVVSHPLSMIGSDGLPHDLAPHPRLWGSFPRVLRHYWRERGLLTLEQAIHKMTGLPAGRFGLQRRGVIQPGCHADLTLLSPDTVADRATYAQPTLPPAGIEAVFVNGRLAMQGGRPVDLHAGRRLTPR